MIDATALRRACRDAVLDPDRLDLDALGSACTRALGASRPAVSPDLGSWGGGATPPRNAPPGVRAMAARVAAGADPAGYAEEALAAADPCNAWVRRDASGLDRARTDPACRHGPLAGVPFAVKDNLAEAGVPLEACVPILDGHVARATATAIVRLRAAGALCVGRTNMDVLGVGSTTATSRHGRTTHPLDASRVPGGSSGGSAVAVARGDVPLALGSDTGGSVRQPAGLCGVVGVRPTWGRVSRCGLVALSSAMDTVGPLTRDVRDAARVLAVMAGPDPRDMTASAVPVPDLEAACDAGARGLRVGLAGHGATDGYAAERCARAGMHPVSWPRALTEAWTTGPATYRVLGALDAASVLARLDGMRFGARPTRDPAVNRALGLPLPVAARIVLGTWLAREAPARVETAQRARATLCETLATAFGTCDLLALPATPGAAFLADDADAADHADDFTVQAALAGCPALVLPASTVDGLPWGLQLVAPPWHEARLFAAAAALEALPA
jgi:aspartyl-tRNA(Asn)/glutamyl-tRNA(Gln) amidotransferase subunit A